MDQWRNTPPGVLLPIGAGVGVAFVTVAADSSFHPVVRAVFLLAALTVVAAIAVWVRRIFRSHGKRARRTPPDHG